VIQAGKNLGFPTGRSRRSRLGNQLEIRKQLGNKYLYKREYVDPVRDDDPGTIRSLFRQYTQTKEVVALRGPSASQSSLLFSKFVAVALYLWVTDRSLGVHLSPSSWFRTLREERPFLRTARRELLPPLGGGGEDGWISRSGCHDCVSYNQLHTTIIINGGLLSGNRTSAIHVSDTKRNCAISKATNLTTKSA
jgi:hypothetical protein